ncbi:MAG: glycosyltransferase family 2 protein [Bacteroidia bacterium]|nr:glycosyltransferase family 2 protein [Bacteroidia bacterium]
MNINKLDIILPCFNPRGDWTDRIIFSAKELEQMLPNLSLRYILVNDGSSVPIAPAEIQKLSESLPQFEYVFYSPNHGKGHALRKGMAASDAGISIFTDLDFPYTAESLVKIYRELSSGKTDIAVGIKNQSYYTNLPPMRVKISRFLRFLIRNFLRIPITDTQCGLKGFNEEGRKIFLQTTINRYLADLEFIFLASRQKTLTMKAIPVELREGVVFSKVNLRILLGEGTNFLRIVLRSLA